MQAGKKPDRRKIGKNPVPKSGRLKFNGTWEELAAKVLRAPKNVPKT
jgi:hypothetical protein